MYVNGKHYYALWVDETNNAVKIVNQLKIPYEFEICEITSYLELVNAIKDMHLRGAPLIGVAGAFAVWLASLEAKKTSNPEFFLNNAYNNIVSARPTAVNLKFAASLVYNKVIQCKNSENRAEIALTTAKYFYNSEIENFKKIGENGLPLIKKLASQKNGEPVNILTHCNAGWLACGDYGTATSAIYLAHKKGIKIHVWIDETRPRLQGAKLTAWEMNNEKIPFTVIADNTGGYLMQEGMVDIVIVGADRVAANGDVANKIGTYLKALAAFNNHIPFYVALPSSTIDFGLQQGVHHIAIEKRNKNEILQIEGITKNGNVETINIMPENYSVANYAFDITPAHFVTGLITEQGIVSAKKEDIIKLYSKKAI
ncbi:MAG: S-methyl-5-thioribose-1-phosphate isomerase [Bacteroidetes bacterium CG23_combo_of_CG06-09_8_20_14_all_32_9]|nr:MAG: S-methyl-5-thioribose-1-phosphate isomerase [Bacteroidetes bacterium CG23_combo_of_CG06-09_8_20_14_all_32_9]